ncbi:MAG: hypothetical protein JRJ38_04825 [Deltaproteobacteria bacterium]|nr:hypothetical protein [Deltaproteobacteria bacterium]
MEFKHLDTLLEHQPYELRRSDKEPLFLEAMKAVALHHYTNCKPYKTLCDKRGFDPEKFVRLSDLPYLPTSVFKDALLLSIPEKDLFREINSSATTTGRPSRIGLDKPTSLRQSKCFNRIVLERLSNKRRKFAVLDVPESIKRTSVVGARSSTIRSLLFCASEAHTCVEEVDGKFTIDEERLDELLMQAEKDGEQVVIFGFTYILYAYVVRPLLQKSKTYNLNGSKIIHIGGWKKLESEKVSPEKLIVDCSQVFGVKKGDVVDFYGFTEQSGMVYPTCEEVVRHMPVWGDVLARDPLTLRPLPPGKEGLLQFITPIQTSYPGHSVLTEDMGYIVGVDNCPCGRKGTAFKVVGRAKQVEVRGCGDIMAEKFA